MKVKVKLKFIVRTKTTEFMKKVFVLIAAAIVTVSAMAQVQFGAKVGVSQLLRKRGQRRRRQSTDWHHSLHGQRQL